MKGVEVIWNFSEDLERVQKVDAAVLLNENKELKDSLKIREETADLLVTEKKILKHQLEQVKLACEKIITRYVKLTKN